MKSSKVTKIVVTAASLVSILAYGINNVHGSPTFASKSSSIHTSSTKSSGGHPLQIPTQPIHLDTKPAAPAKEKQGIDTLPIISEGAKGQNALWLNEALAALHYLPAGFTPKSAPSTTGSETNGGASSGKSQSSSSSNGAGKSQSAGGPNGAGGSQSAGGPNGASTGLGQGTSQGQNSSQGQGASQGPETGKGSGGGSGSRQSSDSNNLPSSTSSNATGQTGSSQSSGATGGLTNSNSSSSQGQAGASSGQGGKSQSQPSVPLTSTLAAQLRSGQLKPSAGSWKWLGQYPTSLVRLWNPNVDSVITKGAVMSFESQHNLKVDGVVGPHVYKALLQALSAQQKDSQPYAYVTVSKSGKQHLDVWQNGKKVYTTLANTGISASPTPNGTFAVYLRYKSQTMQGKDPTGKVYKDPGVPWVSYFCGGCAIHGFQRATYGSAQSLGCVELPLTNAQHVYDLINYGTLVSIE